ncbi:hypothetical protein [Methylobacterium sp. J-070]|uniref:hypothetical protein n=1 Tax=Methylobacterium sp. J-070 TaxID=2836650 RepID=UPI001FB8CCC2|nr:hypothetical protein [Methylobacterium sp. J-070]MCJ2053990.1 hypothetical protein [Methylobacterium sp. J-070]
MADDRLRIVASVDDQFSKPLEKLRGELANTARVPGLDDLRKRFSDIEGTITRLRQTGAQLNTAGGIGGMLGLGSLTGIASVAGLAASMRDLARTQVEMRHFSRETGIASGHLRELQELGKRFQIAPEAMTGAATSFAETMYDVQHGLGEAYGQMLQKAPGLAKELRNSKDNTEALGHALGWLSKQTDAIEQKRWADALGLGGLTRLFTDGPKALQDAWKQVQASGIGNPNPELEKQSKALIDAMTRFDTSVEAMKRTWAPGLLGEMANAVDKLSGSFGKFADAWEKLRSGHPLDALKIIDGTTDMGVGERKNAPPLKPATSLDEQLDAQMRGQTVQTPAEKDRADRIAAAEARLAKARENLGYEQRRFPVKDEGAIKTLTEEMRKLNEELRQLRDGGATRQGVSFDATGAGGLGGLIQRASLGFGGGYGAGGGGFGPGSSYGAGVQPFRRFRGEDGGDAGGGTPTGSSAGNLTKLIEEEAKKAGINPRIMQGIRAGESGHRQNGNNPAGAYDKKDDALESSWGPFQLNRRRGLGVQFEKETGLDVRDPRTIPDQVRWVAQGLAKNGRSWLRNWMGYHGDRDADPRWGDSGYVPDGGDTAGLRVKSAEATAGGSSASGLTTLLKRLQDGNLPGGLDRVTALNDRFHHRVNPGSMHTKGLAGDVTLHDQRRSAEAAEAIRQRLREAGLTDRDFKVMDEYRNPSGHATGGHIHTQFSTHEAAERYQTYVEAQEKRREEARANGRRPDVLADPNDERRKAPGGMLKRAREAGVVGGAAGGGGQHGRILGEISLKGFPAGTRADFKGEGVVQSVKLNRGSTMSAAEA